LATNTAEIDGESQEELPDPGALSFDDMVPVDPDGRWISLEVGEPVVGTLLGYEDDVGENGSRLYKMLLGDSYPALEDGDPDVGRGEVAIFYGAANLNRTVDRGGVGRGTILGIEKTEETYETENGTGYVFDVRTADKREA